MFTDETPVFEFRGPMGVPIQVGNSLFFLMILLTGLGSGGDFFFGFLFAAAIVGSIFLHELGHAWGALVQGVPVKRIMLYGGGGFCQMARSTSAYEDELIVPMGPIVNLTIWAVGSLLLPFFEGGMGGWILWQLAQINLMLALFNLLPVMPLDGGRIFHLLLLRIFEPTLAVRIAGVVGLLFVFFWIPLAIFGFFLFGFVLLFVPSLAIHWEMVMQSRRRV